MKAIAAVDQNWAIGNKGNLLVHISEDMKNFRRLTLGKTVIYGRKTLETFPHAKPFLKEIILFFREIRTIRLKEQKWCIPLRN